MLISRFTIDEPPRKVRSDELTVPDSACQSCILYYSHGQVSIVTRENTMHKVGGPKTDLGPAIITKKHDWSPQEVLVKTSTKSRVQIIENAHYSSHREVLGSWDLGASREDEYDASRLSAAYLTLSRRMKSHVCWNQFTCTDRYYAGFACQKVTRESITLTLLDLSLCRTPLCRTHAVTQGKTVCCTGGTSTCTPHAPAPT